MGCSAVEQDGEAHARWRLDRAHERLLERSATPDHVVCGISRVRSAVSSESEGRHALVVATARYSDAKLQQLRAPAADAELLAAVLRDPAKGDFEVEVLLDESHSRLTRGIASFFRDRRPQDLLLLHFSCHGVKDDRGELYLAAADTELDLLSATGVAAAWLTDQISRTRARRTVVLLDGCFSGSFPFGMRPRGSDVDAPGAVPGARSRDHHRVERDGVRL